MIRTATAKAASPAQFSLINRLAGEKDTSALSESGTATLAEIIAGNRQIGMRIASLLIDEMFRLPRKPAERSAEYATPGYYVQDGVVFHVQENKAKTNCYAKRLVISGNRGRWEYAPGIHRTLKDSDKLTVEEAARLGHLHGVCMICGRELTVKESVERGIGPVCITKI